MRINHSSTHDMLYDEYYDLIFPQTSEKNKIEFLRYMFMNYHTDAGMRLTYNGYMAVNNDIEFAKFDTKSQYLTDDILFVIDTASKSPWYLKKNELYISDGDLIFQYIIAGDFLTFISLLKKTYLDV